MSVYFIRSQELVKIGFSENVRVRTQAIIRSLREGGELIGWMSGGRAVEKHLHTIFSKDREYGEWFRSTERLETLITTISAKEPPKDELIRAQDRVQTQEERYAEEGAYFLRQYFRGVKPTLFRFQELAQVLAISAWRLEGIYNGNVCPITCGEYVVLRMACDASLSTERPVHLDPLPEKEKA